MTAHKTDGEVTQEEMEIALEFEKKWKYSSQPLYELVAVAIHQYGERCRAKERAKAEKLVGALEYTDMKIGCIIDASSMDRWMRKVRRALSEWREGNK